MSGFIYPELIEYGRIDLSWFIGRAITDVTYREPNYWRFEFGPTECITTQCLWRIVRAGRLVRTGLDHGQQFGLPAPVDAVHDAVETLIGKVAEVELREATADFYLTFEGGLRLEIIPDSGGYESWQLHAPTGRRYVAQGGGQICTWTE